MTSWLTELLHDELRNVADTLKVLMYPSMAHVVTPSRSLVTTLPACVCLCSYISGRAVLLGLMQPNRPPPAAVHSERARWASVRASQLRGLLNN